MTNFKRKGNVVIAILAIGALIAGVLGFVAIEKVNKVEQQQTSTNLGAFRPSNYVGKLLTRLSEGGAESTFRTTPNTAADGSSLTNAKLGDFIVFTINPGAANEEKISVSAVATSSGGVATWTVINRGLSFTENGAVTANKHAHAIGETVIISNDDHFLQQQYVSVDDDQTITGIKTFPSSSLPRASTTPTYGAGDELKFVTYGQLASTSFAGVSDSSLSAKGIVEIASTTELANGSSVGDTSAPIVPQASSFSASPVLIVMPAPTLVSSTSGGSIASGTYFYVVSQTNNRGESLKSTEASVNTSGTVSSVTISWAAVSGASYYSIYRATSTNGYGLKSFIATTSSTSYIDTAALVSTGTILSAKTRPDVAVPVSNASGTIDPGYIAQDPSNTYNFRGQMTLASTTVTGPLTITASSSVRVAASTTFSATTTFSGKAAFSGLIEATGNVTGSASFLTVATGTVARSFNLGTNDSLSTTTVVSHGLGMIPKLLTISTNGTLLCNIAGSVNKTDGTITYDSSGGAIGGFTFSWFDAGTDSIAGGGSPGSISCSQSGATASIAVTAITSSTFTITYTASTDSDTGSSYGGGLLWYAVK